MDSLRKANPARSVSLIAKRLPLRKGTGQQAAEAFKSKILCWLQCLHATGQITLTEPNTCY
jgi:hypothetical protein